MIWVLHYLEKSCEGNKPISGLIKYISKEEGKDNTLAHSPSPQAPSPSFTHSGPNPHAQKSTVQPQPTSLGLSLQTIIGCHPVSSGFVAQELVISVLNGVILEEINKIKLSGYFSLRD